MAIDLDLAIAARGRHATGERLRTILDDEEGDGFGRFCTAVLMLLSQ